LHKRIAQINRAWLKDTVIVNHAWSKIKEPVNKIVTKFALIEPDQYENPHLKPFNKII
jgi:hypothetical protein